MKERQPKLGLARICRLFGVTRQAYYQHLDKNMDIELEEELIIKEVYKPDRADLQSVPSKNKSHS